MGSAMCQAPCFLCSSAHELAYFSSYIVPFPALLTVQALCFSVHHQALPCSRMQMSTCSLAPHIHCTFQLFHARVLCRDSGKLSRYPAKFEFEDLMRLVIGSPLSQISQSPCLPPLPRPSPTLPMKSMSPSPPQPILL